MLGWLPLCPRWLSRGHGSARRLPLCGADELVPVFSGDVICAVFFEIVGGVSHVQTIATGTSIRQLGRLRRLYGPGRWRKMKGAALVRLASGQLRRAELHWYEAHGVGKRNMKFKRYLD